MHGSSIRRPSSGLTPPTARRSGSRTGAPCAPCDRRETPSAEACELYVTGRATDTGRPGPTWTFGGKPLHGTLERLGDSEGNQYQLRIFQGGVFRACGRNGVCGEVVSDK